MKVLILLLQKL